MPTQKIMVTQGSFLGSEISTENNYLAGEIEARLPTHTSINGRALSAGKN